MSKPSVVFFNRVYPPARGASGRVLRDLARGFVRDGWDVTVVTCGALSSAAHERDGAIRIIRLGATGRGRSVFSIAWTWVRMLIAGLSLPRHDLIVTLTDPPMIVMAGRILAKIRKSSHIHWCHDLYPDLLPALGIRLPRPIESRLRIMSRRAMKSCDKVVVIGRCMAKHLTHGGLDPRRITFIPNWPDSELSGGKLVRRRSPASPRVSGAKPYEELFRDEEPKFRILYSGNLGRAHPIQTILDAASLLAPRYPEIEFVFVGDGPQFDRLAQERVRRGLENVRLLPWQPASRLRELMESGDVHIVTMNNESSGLLVPCKLYTAIAVERPCIFVGPEESEAARVIQEFKAGVVIPQGAAVQLAEAIRKFRLDGGAWFAAHEGSAAAAQVFVPDEAIKAWIERARDVVKTPVQPPFLKQKKAA